jgi:hypothetical protein
VFVTAKALQPRVMLHLPGNLFTKGKDSVHLTSLS